MKTAFLLVLSLVSFHNVALQEPTEEEIAALREGIENLKEEAENYQEEELVFDETQYNQVEDEESYDFIVIGGGTSGAVVARKLSEHFKVLVLEAGGSETDVTKIPAVVKELEQTSRNWDFRTESSTEYCLGYEDDSCHIVAGRILGGTSSINTLTYMKGHPLDYDEWGKTCPGWSWKDVEPVFKQIEDANLEMEPNQGECWGKGGPMHIENHRFTTWDMPEYFEAGQYMGLEIFNSKCIYNGIGYSRVHTHKGTAWSTNSGYLDPVKDNLKIITGATVVKILLNEKNEAESVQYVLDLDLITVKANKEIILSAGNIKTAHILQLSGIGPKKVLEDAGINCLVEKPVGEQVSTQVELDLVFTYKSYDLGEAMDLDKQIYYYLLNGTGPLADPKQGDASLAVVNLKNPSSQEVQPDFSIVGSFNEPSEDLKEEVLNSHYKPLEDSNYWTSSILMHYAKSKGSIMPKDNNPFSKPKLDLNLLSDEEDIALMLDAIDFTEKLMSAPSIAHVGATLYPNKISACQEEEDEDYWVCFGRHLARPTYDIFGATKMGPAEDPSAVVDPTLKVHGVPKLRIAGNSVIPVPIGAVGTAVGILIGEKAAEFIKSDYLE